MNHSMRSVAKPEILGHIIKTYHEAYQLIEQESVALLPQMFHYLMNRYGGSIDINELEKAIEHLPDEEGELMLSFAKQWEARGRQEGRQEGLIEGLEKGQLTQQISIARALLRDKIPISRVAVFCKLGEATVKRIQQGQL